VWASLISLLLLPSLFPSCAAHFLTSSDTLTPHTHSPIRCNPHSHHTAHGFSRVLSCFVLVSSIYPYILLVLVLVERCLLHIPYPLPPYPCPSLTTSSCPHSPHIHIHYIPYPLFKFLFSVLHSPFLFSSSGDEGEGEVI